MENYFGIYKKYWRKNQHEGAHQEATSLGGAPYPSGRAPRACGAPGRPPAPSFYYMKPFALEKNQKRTFGTKRRRLEAEPGQELFCSPAERFRRGYFPPGGGNQSHRHHQRSSHRGRTNLHQHLHQHHLISNPSSSLVFNLCPKTSDWYLWVASSVDYIM